ncbi:MULTISPECIES: HAD hydrolase-like protein [unclassified Paenibacillus]|uniref:HAD hydrolase-like protein n=1 Tax=unclassified Paenibacillus TaxID=185978 RepID=UPI00363B9B6C
MGNFDLVLFDLDGTLTDSSEGIANGIQYALSKFGMREESKERLIQWIGPPLLDTFRTYYRFDEQKARQAEMYYRDYYTRKGMYENTVFTGIPQMLDELQQAGTQMLVATSKSAPIAKSILQHFRLRSFFKMVAGSDLDGTRASKSEIIDFALKQFTTGESRKVVMVGDRKHDIVAAHDNGIKSAAVSYGYGTLQELEKVQPTYFVHSVSQLRALLLA